MPMPWDFSSVCHSSLLKNNFWVWYGAPKVKSLGKKRAHLYRSMGRRYYVKQAMRTRTVASPPIDNGMGGQVSPP